MWCIRSPPQRHSNAVKHVAFVLVQESEVALAVCACRGNRMQCVCQFSLQRHCNACTVTSETVVLAETLHCTVER